MPKPVETPDRQATLRSQVEIRGLSKTFPGTKALVDVDLDVMPGEVHALVGGNGSGKSTLIKVLCGVEHGDSGSGSLRVGEHTIAADESTPEFARTAAVHVVHQNLGVFLDLSVTENIALGHGYARAAGLQVRWKAQRARAQALIDRFEIEARPDSLLGELGQSVRTQVAIARALQDQGDDPEGLLILDEPTASLPDHEVGLLLDTLRRYASRGQAILYISHRLSEILDLSTNVSVLRDGRNSGTYTTSSLNEENLISLIVGREINRVFPPTPAVSDREVAVSVRGLKVGPLRGVDLEIAMGEVVGIAGLLGSGRTELLRALFGDLRYEGDFELFGKPFRPRHPSDAIKAGIALVPEDRATDAAFPDLSVKENIAYSRIGRYWEKGWIRNRAMRADAEDTMDQYLVKAPGSSSPLSTLSGGNQQKVILARWLRLEPRILLLDEPTQGVDIGAREEIYGSIREAVASGASAILVASDFEELVHVSDRVVVLFDGRVSAEVTADISVDRVMQLAHQGSNGEQGR